MEENVRGCSKRVITARAARHTRFVGLSEIDPLIQHSTSLPLHSSTHLHILHLSFSYLSCSVKLEHWSFCQSASIILHWCFFCVCARMCVNLPVSCSNDKLQGYELKCNNIMVAYIVYILSMHTNHNTSSGDEGCMFAHSINEHICLCVNLHTPGANMTLKHCFYAFTW